MADLSETPEKRDSVRLDFSCSCSYSRFDDQGNPVEERPSMTLNLSPGGLGLQSSFQVDTGEILQITLPLGDRLITFRGNVVYVNPAKEEGFRFGISIKDIDKMDRIVLNRFIYYFNPT